jgi:hypothetical protein
LEVVSVVTPVAWFWAWTVQFGMAAEVESFTLPWIVPAPLWGKTGELAANNRAARKIFLVVMRVLL